MGTTNTEACASFLLESQPRDGEEPWPWAWRLSALRSRDRGGIRKGNPFLGQSPAQAKPACPHVRVWQEQGACSQAAPPGVFQVWHLRSRVLGARPLQGLPFGTLFNLSEPVSSSLRGNENTHSRVRAMREQLEAGPRHRSSAPQLTHAHGHACCARDCLAARHGRKSQR